MDAHSFNGSDDREQVCTEDFDLCSCPSCESWRDNREPSDADREAIADRPSLQERYVADWYEKRRVG